MIEHNPTYIYSPSKTYGGVEVLFERYIRWGHKHGCKYIIVDSVGGSFSKRLSDICEACDINQPPPTRSGVFITTSGHILNGLAWAAPSPKLKPLIWIVHPHEWISTAIPFFYFVLNKFGYTAAKIYLTLHYTQIKRIKNIWATLDKKGSLVCMDGACLRSGKYFIDQNLAPPLLPIPSPIMLSSPMPIRCKKFEDILCIGYFGRIDLHKSNAIYTFVHDLMKVNRGRAKNLKLIIVGEGYYTQSVESLCKSFSIEIDLCGAMKNDDGRAFLASSCDLGIAMGTAALDLAGAGLPTIIINPSIRFPTKQPSLYRFVNEIMDFTLGEFIDSPFFDRGGLPLDQIIKLINDQSDIAEKGIEYVSSMHKPEKIYMKLEDIIRNINIYVGDLDQLVKSTINYVESQRKLATLILRRKIM